VLDQKRWIGRFAKREEISRERCESAIQIMPQSRGEMWRIASCSARSDEVESRFAKREEKKQRQWEGDANGKPQSKVDVKDCDLQCWIRKGGEFRRAMEWIRYEGDKRRHGELWEGDPKG
jgi:hypothetical protein